MSNEYSDQCTQCGSTINLVERWVACGSKACWSANGQLDSKGIWNFGHIEFWKILMCPSCLLKAYVYFLSDRIKRSLTFLKLCPLMLGAGILVIWLAFFHGDMKSPLTIFCSVFGFTLAVVSLIGAPIALIQYDRNARLRKSVKDMNTLPGNKIDDAFKGEAKRIITALEKKSEHDVFGGFDLPAFISLSGYPYMLNSIHEIYSIGLTRLEAEIKLPSDWKKHREPLINGAQHKTDV